MDNGIGGIGRYAKERRLPTLRQEPLLPTSPPSDSAVGQFEERSRDALSVALGENHRSSSRDLLVEKDPGRSRERPPSGRIGGPQNGSESDQKNLRNERHVPRLENGEKGEESKRQNSREGKRRGGEEDPGKAELSEHGSGSFSARRIRASTLRLSISGEHTSPELRTEERSAGEGRAEERAAKRDEARRAEMAAEQGGAVESGRERSGNGSQNRSTSGSREGLEDGSRERRTSTRLERHTERDAAAEEERRRRKEERRIKRAEKEERRAARARRGEGDGGAKERNGSGNSSREQTESEQISAEQRSRTQNNASSGSRNKVGESANGVRSRGDSRDAERIFSGDRPSNVGEARRDEMQSVRNGTSEGDDGRKSNKGKRLKEEVTSGKESHLEKGSGGGGPLGRGLSIMNEIYEEEDETMLLHSTFKYDESTGQLTSAMASSLPPTEEKKQRLYVEGVTDGYFHRTHTAEQGDSSLWSWWRPATWQRREAEVDDVEVGTSSGIVLRVACEQVASCLSLVAHFSNSLLGGFALLNFYLTYLYYAGTLPGGFLAYYAPIAVSCQRTFLVLTSICLLAACDKYAKDKLAEWKPRGNVQWRHDLLTILAFFLAFVLSVVGAPFEDYISYQNKASSDWYTTVGSTAHFKARLKAWHVMNFVRLGACGVGFLVVMLDGNTALRTAKAKSLQAARLERTAGAAALTSSLARANAISQSMQMTRVSHR